MKLRKAIVSLLAGAMIMGVTVPAFAAASLSGKVTASGSTAILPLAKKAAEEFMEKNPGVTVNIGGGGSFTGLKQVAEGSVDLGNSDVPAEGDGSKGLVDHKVAVAPFVIITNKSNPVDNLTQQQLVDIFTGKIKNWKEVGGEDKDITIIGRSKTSGSRATIKSIVLKGQEFTNSAVTQDSNGTVRRGVSGTPGSIGYVDAAYIDDSIKVLKYNGVPYSDDNVIDGKYPIWTYEYMYTKGEAQGVVKAYIDYVLSPSFQNSYLEKLNFISMTKMEGRKALTETKAPVVQKPVAAVKNTTVVLNGKKLAFDVAPIIENGRTLVPVRALFEALGAKVSWDAKTQTVTATKAKTKVTLKVGARAVHKNNSPVTLDVPAKIVKGRTLVPLRFAGEAFGGQVAWNSSTQTATITLK